jgi:methionyl aminopeptidase
MISVKSPKEIAAMREGGKKIWGVLQMLLSESVVGMKLQTIEDHAQEYIKKEGGTPSFSTVRGYSWATCLCVNDQVVHGIPNEYVLQEGDVLTIDIGMVYKGMHTDTAWTKLITSKNEASFTEEYKKKSRFLQVGIEALEKSIGVAQAGNRVGHISQMTEKTITEAGYDVVRSLTGHGVGRKLHEEPLIPEYLDKPIERTPLLTPGMTIAIEVIYAMGKGAIVYANRDGWTLSTKDHSLSAVFERSIAINEGETTVLTGS